jgi:hypothetical protein
MFGDRFSLFVLREIVFGDSRYFRELWAGSEEGVASKGAAICDRTHRTSSAMRLRPLPAGSYPSSQAAAESSVMGVCHGWCPRSVPLATGSMVPGRIAAGHLYIPAGMGKQHRCRTAYGTSATQQNCTHSNLRILS